MFKVDFVPQQQLSGLHLNDKIKFIVSRVKDSSILVVEEGLDPHEEATLITRTMEEIDFDRFSGVKLVSFETTKNAGKGRFSKKAVQSRYTIIAPYGLVDVLKQANGQVTIEIKSETGTSLSMDAAAVAH